MIRLTYRAAAAADLRQIARNTKARWSEDQARIYGDRLRKAIKSLRKFPLRFPEFNLVYHGLRRMNCGQHAVFYLVLEDRIEIVRVLHVASNFERWL